VWCRPGYLKTYIMERLRLVDIHPDPERATPVFSPKVQTGSPRKAFSAFRPQYIKKGHSTITWLEKRQEAGEIFLNGRTCKECRWSEGGWYRTWIFSGRNKTVPEIMRLCGPTRKTQRVILWERKGSGNNGTRVRCVACPFLLLRRASEGCKLRWTSCETWSILLARLCYKILRKMSSCFLGFPVSNSKASKQHVMSFPPAYRASETYSETLHQPCSLFPDPHSRTPFQRQSTPCSALGRAGYINACQAWTGDSTEYFSRLCASKHLIDGWMSCRNSNPDRVRLMCWFFSASAKHWSEQVMSCFAAGIETQDRRLRGRLLSGRSEQHN